MTLAGMFLAFEKIVAYCRGKNINPFASMYT